MGRVIGRSIRALLARETGATAVEYAIMVSLVAAVIIIVVTALGLSVRDLFGSIPAF